MGPLKISQCQIWVDLLAACLATDKLDGQLLGMLQILWRQLQPKQQYGVISEDQ